VLDTRHTRMPGMDGLELQHRLGEINKRFPILFVTAHASENKEKRAKEGGAVGVLRKPVNEGLLFNAIQAALGRQRESDAKRRHLNNGTLFYFGQI